MSQYSSIKAAVNAYIKQNGRKEITGRILNAVLNATIDSLGKFYQFAGVAVPTTDPEDPDQNVCYLAGEPGTYTHFDNIVLENEEIALLFYNGTWTKQRMLIGIQEVSASVDSQTGTPSVDVSYSEGQLVLTFHNLKGDKGDTGDPAGFGSIGATVDSNIGTPGVTVVSSGPATAKELMFNFTNLKGETGVTSVIATVDNTQGTPSCTVSLVGQQLTLAFSGLKGLKGDTGVSADYPITIYNGLDSDATDQALAAYQGKVLDGKITQLEAEVTDIDSVLDVVSDEVDETLTVTPATTNNLFYVDYPQKVMEAGKTYSVHIQTPQPLGQSNVDVMFFAAGSGAFDQRYRTMAVDLSLGIDITITPTVDIYRYGVWQTGGTAGIPISSRVYFPGEAKSTRLDGMDTEIETISEEVEKLDETIATQEVKEQDLKCEVTSFVCRNTPIMLQGVTYRITLQAAENPGQTSFELWVSGPGKSNVFLRDNKVKIQTYGSAVDLSQEKSFEYVPLWDVYAIGCGWSTGITNTKITIEYCIYRRESKKFYDIGSDLSGLGEAVSNDYFKLGACRFVDYGKFANPAIGIITMGQSNADGRIPVSDFPESVTLPDETVVPVSTAIERCKFIKGDNGSNYGANGNKTFSNYNNTGQWAFDQIVYNLVNNAIGGGQDFYVVKQTLGGTPLVNDVLAAATFYPDIAEIEGKVSETLHATMLIRRAMELNPEIRWRAIFYHQGETDINNKSYDDYYNALKNLIYYLRGVVGNPRLPFIFGTIPTNSAGYSEVVNNAQKRIANDVNDTYLVDMGESSGFLTTDNTGMHFVAQDAINLGINMYEIMRNAGGMKPYESSDA